MSLIFRVVLDDYDILPTQVFDHHLVLKNPHKTVPKNLGALVNLGSIRAAGNFFLV